MNKKDYEEQKDQLEYAYNWYIIYAVMLVLLLLACLVGGLTAPRFVVAMGVIFGIVLAIEVHTLRKIGRIRVTLNYLYKVLYEQESVDENNSNNL